MKTRNILSILVLGIGLFTTTAVSGQSCDTLRNYIVPANNTYTTWTSSTPGLLLGQDKITANPDTYNVDVWAEPYDVGTSNTQVRAVRMLPHKIQDNSGSASLTIEVYDDAAGEPGTLLGSQSVNYSDLNNEMVWSTVEFNTPVSVTGQFFVGYRLSYTSPVDTFALATTQPTTNYTMFHLTGPTGAPFTNTWHNVSDIYQSAPSIPINSAFAFDVLTSTGTIPVPTFTGDNGVACLSGSFTGLDASGTTGDVDVYEWWLTDDPYSQKYTDDFGINATLNPTTATPSNQRIYLWTDGACVTRGVYSTVTVNPDVTATVNVTNTTCGNANGELTITASGGDGTYLYSIDGGTTTQSSGTFSGLNFGNYNVEVTSPGNGCTFSQAYTITNTPPEVITMGSNQTICAGETATITASGNGTIEWFDGATSLGTGTSMNVSPTATTTYNAVLTDGNGCTDAQTVDVVVNPVPTFTLNSADVTSCGGMDGEITIDGLNPNTSYDVSYDDGSIVGPTSMSSDASGSITISGLNAGNYTDFSVDLAGCTTVDNSTIAIIEPTPPTFTSNTTDPSCGNSDGQIVITPGSGFTITDYSIDGGSTTQPTGTFTNLAAGSYSIVITEANGCTTTGTVSLNNAAGPSIDNVNTTDPTCSNNDGLISITASGGTGTLTYQWFDSSNNPIGTTNTITGLGSGVYTVVVTDDNGCVSSVDATLVPTSTPDDASFTLTDFCSGAANTANITGTTGGTFSIIAPTGDGATINGTTGEITNGVGGTTYTVEYTTNGACPDTQTQDVTVNASPTYTTALTDPSCGNADGEIVITPGSGFTITDYSIDGGSTTQPTGTFANLAAGSYSIVITEANGCTTTGAETLNSAGSTDDPSFTLTDFCEGASNTANITGTPGGTFTIVSPTGDGATIDGSTGEITNGVAGTTYTVQYETNSACPVTETHDVTVTASPTVNAGQDQTVCEGDNVTLTASATGGTISWDNNISNGVAFTATTTTTYTATADDNGCIATDNVTVTVNPLPAVDAGQDQTTCVNYDAIGLTGTPAGGVFTGPGMSGYDFEPSTAGEGTHTITYTYTDGNGCENSATVDITVDPCLGIAENELNSVTIAPNPASDYIEVEVGENNSIESVQILSLEGQTIAVGMSTVDSQTVKINVSSVAKGTYFIRLSTEKGQVVKKIVVN